MISQLYPLHDDPEHEQALDSTLDGRHAAVLAKRRRAIDASPLAQWLEGRAPNTLEARGAHRRGLRPGVHQGMALGGAPLAAMTS